MTDRQREAESGTAAGRVTDHDRAAVGLDHRLADREPDAARPAAVSPPERLEDAGSLRVAGCPTPSSCTQTST